MTSPSLFANERPKSDEKSPQTSTENKCFATCEANEKRKTNSEKRWNCILINYRNLQMKNEKLIVKNDGIVYL